MDNNLLIMSQITEESIYFHCWNRKLLFRILEYICKTVDDRKGNCQDKLHEAHGEISLLDLIQSILPGTWQARGDPIFFNAFL